jgi:uncharacterized protein (TIGR03437 family)
MIKLHGLWLIVFALPALAQTSRPPVVLVNGYQATCNGSSDSSATFGSMQTLLAADGWQVAYFDNCSVEPGTTGSARPNIEQLAQAFGNFLDSLGAPQVDVVAHSMGGLIVRAYLAGKLPQGVFSPPAVVPIRKAVFIATPHAGLLAISGLVGGNTTDSQTVEMFAGSNFLWDLATWNQRMDDLRGIDALTLAGNLGGSDGSEHSNDGVVVLTSASLAVTLGADRVRVLPYCHANDLPSLLCDGPGIAVVTNRSHPTYQIVTSFLLDTASWQSIGNDASQDAVLSKRGGLLLDARDNLGNAVANPGAAVLTDAQQQGDLPWNSEGVFFADYLPPGQDQVRVGGATYPVPIVSGGHIALEVKPGPKIALVAPAAGNVSTLDRSPDMLVAIYGSNLGEASVTIDGIASPVLFDSSGQINTIVPATSSGLVQLSVANAMGQDTLNVLLAPAVPAVFSADGSGTGAALAFHASDSSAVSSAHPAHPGETISIFLTGLGVPAQAPVLQANGVAANVIAISPLAGSPGVIRLNFVAPQPEAGSTSVQLQAAVGNFLSNVVTLDIAP